MAVSLRRGTACLLGMISDLRKACLGQPVRQHQIQLILVFVFHLRRNLDLGAYCLVVFLAASWASSNKPLVKWVVVGVGVAGAGGDMESDDRHLDLDGVSLGHSEALLTSDGGLCAQVLHVHPVADLGLLRLLRLLSRL